MNKEKHNGIIGIWKFIFAIVIMLYHSRRLYIGIDSSLCRGGYIAVEFFFIVSGFYFVKSIIKENYNKESIGKETIAFVFKKIKSFFPYILVAFFINIIVRILFLKSFTTSQYINGIWSFLLLRQFGFRSATISGQLWYLSVMLMSMFILYPLVKKYKENFILIFSPLIVIFIMGWLYNYQVSLDQSYARWIGFAKTGTLRGFAEINLGMLIYLLSERLKNVDYTKFGKLLLSLVSEGLLILVLIVTSKVDSFVNYDYVMLLFISIAILIMVSKKTYEYKWLSNNTISYFERLSMPIFIVHSAIIDVFNYTKLINLDPVTVTIGVVITTIVFSMIEMAIIDFIKKKQLLAKCSKLIIKKTV